MSSLIKYFGMFLDANAAFYFGTDPAAMPILHLDVTERCNARCRICNLWKKPAHLAGQELTLNELEAIFNDAKGLGCLVVSIGGGEPLVRSDIFEMIRMIRSRGMSAHMDTNGFLLSDKTVASLREAGLLVASVSLDSHIPDVHNNVRGVDCFASITQGIRLLKSIAPEIKVIINCVLHKQNIGALNEMYLFARDLGADGIKFPPIHRMAKQDDLDIRTIADLFLGAEDIPAIKKGIEALINLDKKYGLLMNSHYYLRRVHYMYDRDILRQRCFAGLVTCLVLPYGEVSACYNFCNQGIVAGNIRQNSLREIWSSEQFGIVRRQARHCVQPCWDLCTKEPSLRCDVLTGAQHFGMLRRELDAFT